MKILHVSCSPHGQRAESDKLARKIILHLLMEHPEATLLQRVIGDGSIPHIDANYALAQHSGTAEVTGDGSMALSDILIGELEEADVVVIGTPMHNYSVPSSLKAWIDHVVRARRTFQITPAGKVGGLRDRPVFVAVASGGRFSGEHVHQPDFLTPYLRAILGMVGLHDLTFFTVEGTVAAPAVLAETRARADRALREFFAARDQAGSAERLGNDQSTGGSPRDTRYALALAK
ncbi:FMN-dependent NADH-azoreductase [Luteibacter sp. NPDC031894]|uniref:FMN-dependent NADH-azoreductase n=1 Tax=Luteibacter sp. NPDC031894 TaxID=3390572 RepID=UPI003D00A0FC